MARIIRTPRGLQDNNDPYGDLLDTITKSVKTGSMIGDVLGSAQQAQPASQYLKIPNGAPPQPGVAGPALPPNPLGPLANTPMDRVNSLSPTLLNHILGQGANTTVWWDPVSQTPSLTPVPGGIPLSGFKGPQAMQDVMRSSYMQKHMAYQNRIQSLRESTSLSPDQKLKLAVISAHSRVLGNPMIELPQDETQALTANLESELADLEGQAGGASGAASPTKPTPTSGKGGAAKGTPPRPQQKFAPVKKTTRTPRTVHNRVEYDAIPSGEQFVWNGQTVIKQ